MSKKFIPNGDLDFLTMASHFARPIVSDPGRFAVREGDAQALADAVAAYEQALQTARMGGARSQIATAAKEQARVTLERLIRRLANVIRADDTIDGLAKLELGLRERAAKPKVLTVPNEAPRLRFQRAIHEGDGSAPEHELSFVSRDFKPRPPGATRIELFVDLIAPDAEIPTHPNAPRGDGTVGCPFYLRSYTRSPFRLMPPLAEVPMRVVYWARWADSAGNVGPFSATAVGWIEGGSHYRKIKPNFNHAPEPLRVTVGTPSTPGNVASETVIVALLAAAGQSGGDGESRVLPDAASSQRRQLVGPADATEAA